MQHWMILASGSFILCLMASVLFVWGRSSGFEPNLSAIQLLLIRDPIPVCQKHHTFLNLHSYFEQFWNVLNIPMEFPSCINYLSLFWGKKRHIGKPHKRPPPNPACWSDFLCRDFPILLHILLVCAIKLVRWPNKYVEASSKAVLV